MRARYKIPGILFLGITLCQVFFIIYEKGDSRFNLHKKERLTELFLNRTNHDLLFVGSSRTHTDIDPRIIDSLCHVDSYNAGVEGGNLLEFYYTYRAYLVNHPAPRCLVLGLDLGSFDLRRRFFNYTIYLNYIKNPVIGHMLSDNGHAVALCKWLPFLALTDLDDYSKGNALAGLMGATEILPGDYQYKGFLSNTTNIVHPESAPMEPVRQVLVEPEALGYLKGIVSSTERTGTRLIFVYGPEYKHALRASCTNAAAVFGVIDQFAAAAHIPNLRNDSLDICGEPTLFANPGHLNKQGAQVYSRILGAALSRMGVGR
jgi:hypothetical protein